MYFGPVHSFHPVARDHCALTKQYSFVHLRSGTAHIVLSTDTEYSGRLHTKPLKTTSLWSLVQPGTMFMVQALTITTLCPKPSGKGIQNHQWVFSYLYVYYIFLLSFSSENP